MVMKEVGENAGPLFEGLDTSYVNLAALLRYLQQREFAGRVRVELEEYEADVRLEPGRPPHVRESDHSTGRMAEGEGALQRLLVRATAPGGSISVYSDLAEAPASSSVVGANHKPPPRPDFGAESFSTEAVDEEEDGWQDLLRMGGDLVAAVERACLSAGADFPNIFHEVSFELSDDYPFLDPSRNGFGYAHGAIEARDRIGQTAFLQGIVEALRRVVNRIATGTRERHARERVALELAVLFRRREAALVRFQLLPMLDRIAGTRVV